MKIVRALGYLTPVLVALVLLSVMAARGRATSESVQGRAREVATSLELWGIRTVLFHAAIGGEAPSERNASEIVDRDLTGGPGTGSVDAWGSPYEYEQDGESWRVTSRGPDGELGTSDDIVSEFEAHGVVFGAPTLRQRPRGRNYDFGLRGLEQVSGRP